MNGVSIWTVRALVAAVESCGVPVDGFLVRIGLPREVFEDDDARVSLEQYQLIVRSALSVTENAALGLRFGTVITPAAFDVLGSLLQHSVSLRSALQLIEQYATIVADGWRIALEEREGTATIRMELPGMATSELRFFAEFALSAVVCTFLPMFTSEDAILAVHFAHEPPPYRAEYSRVFGGRERFGSAFHGVEVTRDVLDKRSYNVSKGVHTLLKQRADTLLLQLDRGVEVSDRVKSWLELNVQGAKPRMREVARALGTSERTLRRLLTREGADFGELVDQVRAKRATHLLKAGQLTVQQVAHELGFDDPLAFSKAYRRWTGVTPSAVRGAR